MDQFFDPDLWDKHYMENFLEAFSQESVQVYNLPNASMALQILASLKKEAPWLFDKLPREDIEYLLAQCADRFKEDQAHINHVRT